MRKTTILMIVSWVSLAVLMLPPILFLAGCMELITTKWIMLAATVIWFATATPWMWKQAG
jgi:hypothetical protein